MKNFLYPIIIAAVVSFAGVTATAQVPKTNTARQSWEYKSIIIARAAESRAPFTLWTEVMADGSLKDLPQPVNVTVRANQLGNEGWELVSITPISNNICGGGATNISNCAGFTSQIMYWFKRPK